MRRFAIAPHSSNEAFIRWVGITIARLAVVLVFRITGDKPEATALDWRKQGHPEGRSRAEYLALELLKKGPRGG